MSNHTLVLPFVTEATTKFVEARTMQEVMSLLLVSGKGAIWYGPGGHAKSDFARSVFRCIDGASVMVVNCHSDLDVADLFGGIDLNALEQEGDRRIQYNVENSWLNRDIVLLEEGLDTPAKTMAALKNTLTEQQLENGAQVFPMNTRVMLMLTNKKPQDVVEFVDEASRNSIAALMERFPLQMIVEWGSYTSGDYMEMFVSLEEAMDGCPEFSFDELLEMREYTKMVKIPREILAVLTELIAEANEQSGGIISPRTAVHARDLIKAAAVINGRDYVIEADIIAVKYLPGMEAIAATIEQKIEAASNRAKAEGLLTDGFRIVETLEALLDRRRGNFNFMLAIMALLSRLEDEVDDMIRPPKQLQDRKEALLEQIRDVFKSAGLKADYMAQAMVLLPEQMLGTSWKVRVEKSNKTLAELLLEKEEAERLVQLEAENGDDWDDEWDEDEDEEYYDDVEEEEQVYLEIGEDIVNRLRNRANRHGGRFGGN